ncbi:MAG: hypothetical protein KDJ38_10675, partial [Gammaproteobacteria bacterium]|nr:hypothetical protein [Gammaproteobacteria bacterium]
QSGAGFAIEPENAAQLAEKVSLLYNDRDLYASAAEQGRRFVAEHYDRSRLAAKFLSVIESLLSEKKQSSAG